MTAKSRTRHTLTATTAIIIFNFSLEQQFGSGGPFSLYGRTTGASLVHCFPLKEHVASHRKLLVAHRSN